MSFISHEREYRIKETLNFKRNHTTVYRMCSNSIIFITFLNTSKLIKLNSYFAMLMLSFKTWEILKLRLSQFVCVINISRLPHS